MNIYVRAEYPDNFNTRMNFYNFNLYYHLTSNDAYDPNSGIIVRWQDLKTIRLFNEKYIIEQKFGEHVWPVFVDQAHISHCPFK